MDKYYLFKSSSRLDVLTIETMMDVHDGLYAIEVESDNELSFRHSDSIERKLLDYIHSQKEAKITVLCAPYADQLMKDLLQEAFLYFPNSLVFPTDVIMKQIGFGNYSSFQPLREYFSRVPYDLLETAGVYLRAGCNALKACEMLYIHRNTFNFRLNNFISLTALDIRDYHNALLLELYFLLSNRY